MSRPTFYPFSYQGAHSISVPTTSSTLNMVTSVKKVVFTKSTTPVWMLPGTPVAQWESAGLLIILLTTKIVLLWLKYYLKGHKSLQSIQLNIYDVVTQICSYNYTYYFELSFENLHQICSCNYTYCLELSFINLAVFSVNKTDSRFFSFKVIFYCLA